MATTGSPEDLFQRLIDINQLAFKANLFDTAYHSLLAAMYCAEQMKTDEPLFRVSQIATEQIGWIDENAPGYEHSTRSAKSRGMPESTFARTSAQALTIIKMRQFGKKK